MSEHTPGPWTCRKANSGEERWWVEADYKGEGPWYLAECAARPGENEANARLIAAAPELLEAALTQSELVAHNRSCQTCGDRGMSFSRPEPCAKSVALAKLAEKRRADAIAKAEGR